MIDNFSKLIHHKIIIIILAAVFLWPLVIHPTWIPMTYKPSATDFLITHLSIARQVHNVLFEYGQIPLWNIFQFSGQPLTADPLSGFGYLPNWLAFLFPYAVTFNLLCLLHLIWSGWGMLTLLENYKLKPATCMFAAVAWIGAPKLIAYIGSGQISTVFALAWVPWLLIAVFNLSDGWRWENGLLTGAILAIIILSDIRWGFYASILGGLYALSLIRLRSHQAFHILRSIVVWIITSATLTLGLTLPLLRFMQYTRRAKISLADMDFLSIEPRMLIALLAPQVGINYEQIIYLGIVPLILAFLGWRKKTLFWVMTVLICGLLSMGGHTFLFPIVARHLPIISWLRVPSRLWFFVTLAMCVLSAFGLDRLINNLISANLRRAFPIIAVIGGAFALMFTVGMTFLSEKLPTGIIRMGILIPITFGLLTWLICKPKKKVRLLPLVFILAMVDLVWVNTYGLTSIPQPEPTYTVKWLQTNTTSTERVYSPSYSLPMPNILQQANGVNPMHLEKYADYIAMASNISSGGYSVSLPDIYIDANTPPDTRKNAQSPDTTLLGALNVRYIASAFPLYAEDLELVFRYGNDYLYENIDFQERVIYRNGEADIEYWSPNKISVSANGSGGEIVLSEINYPGWQVQIDGQAAEIKDHQGIFRSVVISPGEHEIEFVYVPKLFYMGVAISLAGWIAFLLICIPSLLKKKRMYGRLAL